MGFSMLPKIIREDIVSSLTGGFYLDYQQTHLVNIVHLYLWILFLISPLIVYLLCPESLLGGLIYSTSVALLVASIKIATWRLHRLLDLKDPVIEREQQRNLSESNLLNWRNNAGSIIATADPISEDPDIENLNAAFVHAIEERCRRIGQAGLDMADLGDAIRNDQPLLPRSIPSIHLNSRSSNRIAQSEISRMTPRSAEACYEKPSPCQLFDNPGSSDAVAPKNLPERSAFFEGPRMQMDNVNPGSSKELISDQIYGSHPVEPSCIEMLEAADDRSTGKCHNEDSPHSHTPQKAPFRPSPLMRRLPVRRQLSSTAAFLYSTEPNSRSNSVMGADLERCKRIISQLEADVSRLPLRSDDSFTPSLKDLETLNVCPQSRKSTSSAIHTRSYSQRHHRALIASHTQAVRQQARLGNQPVSGVISRQTLGPTDLTDLSLTDTIVYWRRHFASNATRGDSYRTFRSQSLHQPGFVAHRFSLMDGDSVPNRHLGRRSHSLRYSHPVRNHLSISGYRNLPRRPGSALRMRSQPFTDSALVFTRSPARSTPEWRKGVTLLDSPVRIRGTKSTESSKEPPGDKLAALRKKTVISNMTPTDSESAVVPSTPGPSNGTFSQATTSFEIGTGIDESEKSCVSQTSDDCPVGTRTIEVEPASSGDSCEPTSSQSNQTRSSTFVRRTGLVRQHGIRRKFTTIFPTNPSGSVLKSDSSDLLEDATHAQSVREQTNANAVAEEEQQSIEEPSSKISESLTEQAEHMSISRSPASASQPSTNRTVDTLLAQLMGVRSLADAGLTRQQCLAQLRGSLNTEDSESAELDILFAITAAATSTEESVVPNAACSELATSDETIRPKSICEIEQPVAGPSTSLLNRLPMGLRNNAAVEPVAFSVDESSDVPVSHLNEAQSADHNRRSFPQTRAPLRTRPLGRGARVQTQPRQCYVVRPVPGLPLTVRLCIDRLQLDSLFDRSRSIIEPVLSVIFSLLVGLAGFSVLQTGIFRDLSVLSLCFAIAGSHYSLIKSVQPDAASPQHGFNRIIVFSRAIFFCVLATALILTARFHQAQTTQSGPPSDLFLPATLHTGELSLVDRTLFLSEAPLLAFKSVPYRLSDTNTRYQIASTTPVLQTTDDSALLRARDKSTPEIELFGYQLSVVRLAHFVHIVVARLLVIFPILFLVGLIPQIDTALTYFLEQVDIHLFGGSGAANLLSVCFSIFRALAALGISLWFCLSAVATGDPYHYLFSAFWSVQVSLCFLLSRLPSNLSLYATLFPCSLSGQQFGEQLRLLVSELFHFSCLSRLKHKATSKSATESALKRRCRPRWPWSKSRKSKVAAARSPLEPVVWWRTWLPLLSTVGMKSTPRASSSLSGVNRRLLGQQTHPTGDIPLPVTSTVTPPASRLFDRPSKSFSYNELATTVRGSMFGTGKSSHVGPVTLCTGASLPNLSALSGQQPERQQRSFNAACQPVPDSRSSCHALEATGTRTSCTESHTVASSNTRAKVETNPSEHSPDTLFSPNPSVVLTSQAAPGRMISNNCVPDTDSPNDRFETDLPVTTDPAPSQSPQQPHRDTLTESEVCSDTKNSGVPQANTDPLPELIRAALTARLQNDLSCCIVWMAVVFALHASPLLAYASGGVIFPRISLWTVVLCGTCLHYIWPNLRKSYPWLCLARPPVAPHAYGELIRWETGYFWFCWVERNVLIPFVTVLTVTRSITALVTKFGESLATVIILATSMKMLRNGFSAPSRVFITLFFTDLLFTFDFHQISETLPVNYFFVSIFVCKVIELIRKLHFVYIYTAPFRITWGSVFHAIVQIAFIPHAIFMLGNCLFSTILSSPLEPFLASAVFITSYVRPIKFWEVDHQTERMETTNMSLASQLKGTTEQQVMLNSNAIFYERLSRNLQLTLAGDIQLGRLGGLTVGHGDVFILSSDDLNLVIHIIEVGNGLVTFQLRGLEFVGTYCHDHETEALRSTSHNDDGFCCCNPGHYPGMLSLNAVLRMRCMTWQFIYGAYCVEGYRMTSHSADTVVQLNDLRKVLVTRFVQCIIYYVIKLPNLQQRLAALTPLLKSNNFLSESHYDLDPVFMRLIDEDFDDKVNGVTRRRFVQIYLAWIRYCLHEQSLMDAVPSDSNSPLVSLCYALSIVGRRCMGGIQAANFDVSQVLRGIHDIFKGDIHVLTKDDWVLTDIELLQTVITPAMRIALKLYQDNFLWASELTHVRLHLKIVYTEKNFVICHETDPQWRFAVLNDAHNLFSIRLMGIDSDNVYRFVQLTKGKLNFSAVKINPECVRGLWAGQQREQIFVRNTNHERGSIQGAQHVLRNLVNSSCDPPIGYPIYVSPLLTSFAGTNPMYTRVAGPWFSLSDLLGWLRKGLVRLFTCRRSSAPDPLPAGDKDIELTTPIQCPRSRLVTDYSREEAIRLRTPVAGDSHECRVDRWSSFSDSAESVHQKKIRNSGSAHLTTLAALVHQQNESDGAVLSVAKRSSLPKRIRVKIVDLNQILNDKLSKLSWPSEEWRTQCLTFSACQGSVYVGLEGEVVHRWTPSNPEPNARSFCHRTITLIGFPGGPSLLDGRFIAIWDEGIMEVPNSVDATASSPVTIAKWSAMAGALQITESDLT